MAAASGKAAPSGCARPLPTPPGTPGCRRAERAASRQHRLGPRVHLYAEAWPLGYAHAIARRAKPCQVLRSVERRGELEAGPGEIGRASCRERVEVAVVDG